MSYFDDIDKIIWDRFCDRKPKGSPDGIITLPETRRTEYLEARLDSYQQYQSFDPSKTEWYKILRCGYIFNVEFSDLISDDAVEISVNDK